MATAKKAAIDVDDIQDKALDQVSAADFLTALNNSGRTGAMVRRAWPEKKKYELFDPRQGVVDPVEIATEVARQLKGR